MISVILHNVTINYECNFDAPIEITREMLPIKVEMMIYEESWFKYLICSVRMQQR